MLAVNYVSSPIGLGKVQNTYLRFRIRGSSRSIKTWLPRSGLDIDDYRIREETAAINKLRNILKSRFSDEALISRHQFAVCFVPV
jgi:hypothetical protein